MSSHAPGGLYVQLEGYSFSFLKLCDFENAQFNISPANCRHIASLAAIAFTTGKTVQIYIDNAPTTACAEIPNWLVANTRYFHVYP